MRGSGAGRSIGNNSPGCYLLPPPVLPPPPSLVGLEQVVVEGGVPAVLLEHQRAQRQQLLQPGGQRLAVQLRGGGARGAGNRGSGGPFV